MYPLTVLDTIQNRYSASLSFKIAGNSVLRSAMVAYGYGEAAVVSVPVQNKAMLNVKQRKMS